MKRLWIAGTLAGILLLGQFLSGWTNTLDDLGQGTRSAAERSAITGTAYATDGDTIKLDRKVRVRLSGVAAPERDEVGGTEATAFMARLVNGRSVRCELDSTRSHNRVVGTCFVGGQDIGEAVIAAGLARDCPRFSRGRYASAERPEAASLPFPRYCVRR